MTLVWSGKYKTTSQRSYIALALPIPHTVTYCQSVIWARSGYFKT